MKSGKHIELDRRFAPIDRTLNRDQRAAHSYANASNDAGSGRNWTDLRKSRRVVVLAEGRSGKSAEFLNQTKLLDAAGEFAFWFRLRDLVDQSELPFATSEEQTRFRQWLTSDREAYVFLDSVDESRLKSPGDFVRALDTFRRALTTNSLRRLRLFVSSRGSDWDSDLFEPEFAQRFPIPELQDASKIAHADADERLLVVTMDPLTEAQVAVYLTGLGCCDSESFCKALTRHHAWPFARRPVDVQGLYGFWSEHKRLGSLTELMAFTVQQGLGENTRERADPMSRERVIEGARTLAAASVLCRNRAFRVTQAAVQPDFSALNPADCLPEDWSPEQQHALLMRPLFTTEGYGQVRFHDHRIAEFLAAEWLASILNESQLPCLESLLTCHIDGQRQLRPSLAAIAAWLGTADTPLKADVRTWILEANPGLYFVNGDAEKLDTGYRRQLLAALISRYAGRTHARFEYSVESTSRVANDDLADDLSGYLLDKTLAESLRQELLMVVRHARLTGCLPAVVQLITDSSESSDVKDYAAIVLRDLDDAVAAKQFAVWALGVERLSGFLSEKVIETAFPAVFDTADVVVILRKTNHVWRRFSAGFPWAIKTHLSRTLTPQQASQLIVPMLQMLTEAPHIGVDDQPGTVSARFRWIGDLLPTVLATLLNVPLLNDASLPHIVGSLRMLDAFSEIEQHEEEADKLVRTRSLNHPLLRRAYFWQRMRCYRERHKREPFHLSAHLENRAVLQAHPSDIDWLLRDIREATEAQDRKLAADLAWRMAFSASSVLAARMRIWERARLESGLDYSLASIAVRSAKAWVFGYWYRHQHRPVFQKYWWAQRYRRFNERLRELWYLQRHLGGIRNGTDYRAILVLCQRGVGDRTRRWHPEAWSALEALEGARVMRAVQQGCIAAWPKFKPLLPHEEPVPGNSDGRLIFGLAGIALQAECDATFFPGLDAPTSELVVRYALCEINGFPDWWPDFVRHQPVAVQRVFIECIRGEWCFGAERQHFMGVMYDLAYRGEAAIPLVLPIVEFLLESGDPPNAEVLRYALTVLLGHRDLDRAWLAGLAARRVSAYPDDSIARQMWLSVWLQCQAPAAMDYFEGVLAAAADPEDLMIDLCRALRGARLSQLPTLTKPDYLSASNAKRFIVLVFRFVRPEADPDRAGQRSSSPNARDDAQHFRNGLLPQIEASTEQAALGLLKELASEPALIAHRDYALALIETRMRRSADSDPWQPKDVREFPQRKDVSPKSSRGLFEMASRHLEYISKTVEQGDRAWHRDIADNADEKRIEVWLKEKLLQVNGGMYDVPRNPEKDGLDRPDFLLSVPGAGAVPIELKRADSRHWTHPDLVDGLEKQLVGKYLRAPETDFGIYVLAKLRGKGWEDPDSKGRVMTFEELVERMRQRAAAIKRENPGVRDLAVVSIDFRTRA
ncbi:hypothetical protein [Nevskia sp.]|uniref:hypothetical protein n=1 Tax=Nevskia sp. TaxID=1929292 RepID=UPI0025EBD344|nr:hypothetical protein [Nevskia sp.]